jgi:hypothetical protein
MVIVTLSTARFFNLDNYKKFPQWHRGRICTRWDRMHGRRQVIEVYPFFPDGKKALFLEHSYFRPNSLSSLE